MNDSNSVSQPVEVIIVEGGHKSAAPDFTRRRDQAKDIGYDQWTNVTKFFTLPLTIIAKTHV